MKSSVSPQCFWGIISEVEEAISFFYEYVQKFGQNVHFNLQSFSELVKV